jgi:beta-mannosidase
MPRFSGYKSFSYNITNYIWYQFIKLWYFSADKLYRMKLPFKIVILFCLFNNVVFSQNQYQLNNWKFRQAGSPAWYNAIVPGTVHTDLMKNGIIEDPYYRMNEDKVQWVDKVNWEYKTEFTLTHEMKVADQLLLTFEGLDTYADIYLNGKKISESKDMFTRIEIPIIPDSLHENNELKVYFKSPVFNGLKLLEEYGLHLPADNDQSEKGGLGPNKISVFTRKAPYHYGWDWGPRIVTSGIWKKVYIKPVNKVSLNDLYINQQKITSKRADIIALVDFTSFTERPLQLKFYVNDSLVTVKDVAETNKGSFEKRTSGRQGNSFNVSVPVQIDNPLLWWPNGQGKQPLYTFKAIILSGETILDSLSVTTGLRKIRLVRTPDKEGESFYFEVNGKPLFAKGANYIPSDVFLPDVEPSKYEYIIASAAQANMNMLRVWGGGIYENDIFYDLCDKYGIMVWQDFMFACAMYPNNPEFFSLVKTEAVDNIKRLRNHACIALWCGNNEIEQAWAQYDENRGWGWKQKYNQQQRADIWHAYDTIFHHILPDQVKLLSPGSDYWHSSPSAGMGKLASHSNTSGDMHYWGVWHGNEPISSFLKYKARFMSEYGFQSFPEFESVKRYTEQADWNIESDVMNSHQRSAIGNQRIREYMADSYKVPNNFEDQLYVGQLLQAEAIKIAIKAHRAAMPYCMGSLYWQLNDCWPVASWSGIDYYGRWKALHYFAKKAFKNQIISTVLTDKSINITGVSDIEGTSAILRINLMDFNGNSIWNRSMSVKIPSNSANLLTSIELNKIPALQHKTDALLYVSLVKNERIVDDDIFYLDAPKNLKLPHPDLTIHINQKPGKYDLEITSKNLCKNLMLISQDNAYSFSDNFFDVLPGQTKVVTVKSDLSYDEFEKRLSYIHLQQVNGSN